MKISNTTLAILKSFSGLNQSIKLVGGSNVISVMTPAQNVIGIYQAEETFPVDFPIANMNTFLSGVSLFNNPDFDFTSSSDCIITNDDGRSELVYIKSDGSLMNIPNFTKEMVNPVTANIAGSDLDKINKVASSQKFQNMFVGVEGNKLSLRLANKDTSIRSSYSMDYDCVNATGETYNYAIVLDNFKIAPFDYDVSISGNGFMTFTETGGTLQYIIGMSKQR